MSGWYTCTMNKLTQLLDTCAMRDKSLPPKKGIDTFESRLRSARPELEHITILSYVAMTKPLTFHCAIGDHGETTISEARNLLKTGNCKACAKISKSKKISESKKGQVAYNKGIPMKKEQKELLSEAAIERYQDPTNHPMYGRHHSAETKSILSNHSKSHAGTKMAHERTVSGIKTRKSRGDDLAFFRGKTHTDEAKDKMSKASTRMWDARKDELEDQIIERAKEANISVLGFLDDRRYWLHLQCDDCNSEFEFTKQVFIPSKFKKKLCPVCHPRDITQSAGELAVGDYVESLGYDIERGNRSILRRGDSRKGLELDIYIPELKLAIEYCGLYWHSENGGNVNMYKEYHLDKLTRCEDLGISLITIFEDEWEHTPEIVKSVLAIRLGDNTNPLYARKLEIKEIDVTLAKPFINKHHLQGYTSSSIKIGLFDNSELVSVMTFARPSIAKGGRGKDYWEISRLCSSRAVVGGANRMMKFFKTTYNPNHIISYSDRRWFDGGVYEKMGFTLTDITPPNYWYVSGITRTHRFSMRKGIVPEDDLTLTEWENRQNQGWDRIWDCGNYRFEWVSDAAIDK